MSWTNENVELLKTLWETGISPGEIAVSLTGKTRNAVIGKIHRLGLSGRSTKNRVKKNCPKKTPRKVQKIIKGDHFKMTAFQELLAKSASNPVSGFKELVIPVSERKNLDDLTPTCCRWPIGDPHEMEFHYCGNQIYSKFPYCEFHTRYAFRLSQEKRKKII